MPPNKSKKLRPTSILDVGRCAQRYSDLQPCKGGGHDGLDGVHAVLGLVEDDGLRALENLVRDLQGVEAVLLADLFADGGLEVVNTALGLA